jgi:hypothetical protein
MDKIKLTLPFFEYKNLPWIEHHNVGFENRSNQYESQNYIYQQAGYTQYNSCYKQTFEVTQEITCFASTMFDRFTCSVICQTPGQTLPLHTDTFYKISQQFDVQANDCIRINVFLEDWQSGHYFEINNTAFTNWTKGDAVIIQTNQPHLSGNMGLKPKYTMQITGVKNEFKRC